MATKQATIKTCDVCKETATATDEPRYGGHPFNGWFHIKRHGGATDLESLRKVKEWDICSPACLKKLGNTIKD
jgi:hypothetical protein